MLKYRQRATRQTQYPIKYECYFEMIFCRHVTFYSILLFHNVQLCVHNHHTTNFLATNILLNLIFVWPR